MPSASGHYDEALLAAAPTSTKAQRQEGYSTDLLNPPSGAATPPRPTTTQADVEHGLAHKEDGGVLKKPIPFFRTRKGIIVIAVLVIVVLAAIIGGAVGGSVHHNQNDNGSVADAPSGPSPSADSVGSAQTASGPPMPSSSSMH